VSPNLLLSPDFQEEMSSRQTCYQLQSSYPTLNPVCMWDKERISLSEDRWMGLASCERKLEEENNSSALDEFKVMYPSAVINFI
jgi:hypothetical protein